MENAKGLADKKQYTEAIEAYIRIIEDFSLDMNTLSEIRTELARLYYAINNYENAQHYYQQGVDLVAHRCVEDTHIPRGTVQRLQREGDHIMIGTNSARNRDH